MDDGWLLVLCGVYFVVWWLWYGCVCCVGGCFWFGVVFGVGGVFV